MDWAKLTMFSISVSMIGLLLFVLQMSWHLIFEETLFDIVWAFPILFIPLFLGLIFMIIGIYKESSN